jgi:hypothetical protein
MKKIILAILFGLLSYHAFAGEAFYYTFANQKVPLSRVYGKYTVEFESDLPVHNSLQGERLHSKLYLVTDTSAISNLEIPHKIYPVYLTGPTTEIYLTSRIVLQFKPDIGGEQKRSLLSANGLQLIRAADFGDVYQCTNPLQADQAVYESGLVTYCTPDFITPIVPAQFIPNDKYFGKQFYLHNTGQLINDGHYGTADADIDAPEAWDITKGDSSIVVAVIDDGVENNHNVSSGC